MLCCTTFSTMPYCLFGPCGNFNVSTIWTTPPPFMLLVGLARAVIHKKTKWMDLVSVLLPFGTLGNATFTTALLFVLIKSPGQLIPPWGGGAGNLSPAHGKRSEGSNGDHELGSVSINLLCDISLCAAVAAIKTSQQQQHGCG